MISQEFKIWTEWVCGISGIIIVFGMLVILRYTHKQRPWWFTLIIVAMIFLGIMNTWLMLPISPGFDLNIDR
jgi:1,4-dihydroxy-2-naphthoate octaprenyltransferase